jgi:16S rRNA (cytosine967-C5)-methyltransferase
VAAEIEAALGEEETEAFFAASNGQAPLCLRGRGAGSKELGAQEAGSDAKIRSGKLVSDCLVIEGRGVVPESMESFRAGRVTVEDEGAQAACLLAAGTRKARRVLDLCASPGGKAAHLADMLPNASILACDVSEAKLARLRQTLDRLGLGARVEVRLAKDVLESADEESFDLVLVDAPCSGLGTLRRHPEIRYRRGTQDFTALSKQQSALLDDVWRLVAPGGELAYVVCSVGAQETTGVAERFLREHPEARPAEGCEALPFDPTALRVGEGCWRTLPQRWGCDGFFVARFRRT